MQGDLFSDVVYKDMPGYPGYRVGDDGSVWSCLTRKRRGQRLGSRTVLGTSWHKVVGRTDDSGRRRVSVNSSGKRRHVSANVLVLEAFVGPCPPGMECCHNDGNPANNRLSNLRWDTHQSNMDDMKKHGTKPLGESHGRSILTADNVREIRMRREMGETVTSLGAQFHVSPSAISAICNRRLWKCVS